MVYPIGHRGDDIRMFLLALRDVLSVVDIHAQDGAA